MNLTTDPTVVLAGQSFTAEVYRSGIAAHCDTVFLTGRRGGVYQLAGLIAGAAGLYQVISCNSGAPLRDKCQRPVWVYWLGDVIEQRPA